MLDVAVLGRFLTAFAQSLSVYYATAFVIDTLPPHISLPNLHKLPRPPGQKRRDALRAVAPNLVKALVLTVSDELGRRGLNLMYSGPISSLPALLYVLLSILLMDILHDTWFYWTHRLLHWGPLYRAVHYMHHESRIPSAYSGYSFHVVEAAIVFANEILVAFLFPIHVHVHRVYHLAATIIHNAGHSGFEFAPFFPTIPGLLGFIGAAGGKHWVLNTVQHHDMHHRLVIKHFR